MKSPYFFLFLVFSRPLLAVSPEEVTKWEPAKVKAGIETFVGNVTGSPLIAVKGKGILEVPLWKVASVIVDTKRAPEWVDSLQSSSVIRRLSLTRYLEYNHVGTPFIMKDRDFVSEVTFQLEPQRRELTLVYRPAVDDKAPPTGYVRGEILAGRFHLRSVEPGKKVELTAELHCDPKGAVPKWIVNFFQKDWPMETFEGLRKQVTKPDLQMPAEFKDVLTTTMAY